MYPVAGLTHQPQQILHCRLLRIMLEFPQTLGHHWLAGIIEPDSQRPSSLRYVDAEIPRAASSASPLARFPRLIVVGFLLSPCLAATESFAGCRPQRTAAVHNNNSTRKLSLERRPCKVRYACHQPGSHLFQPRPLSLADRTPTHSLNLILQKPRSGHLRTHGACKGRC